MRVIAKNRDGNYYLSLNDDLEAAIEDVAAKGRSLLTTNRIVLMPRSFLHNVVGRGSWKWFFLSREETDALLVHFGFPPANQLGAKLSNRFVYPESSEPDSKDEPKFYVLDDSSINRIIDE